VAAYRRSTLEAWNGLRGIVNPLSDWLTAGFEALAVGIRRVTNDRRPQEAVMAEVQKFSKHVIDAAERLADVADAVEGKGLRKRNTGARWMLLPAAGAGLYALVTRPSFPRQAKGVLRQAKARASDLPDELLGRVQQAMADSGQKSTRRPAQKSGSSSSRSNSRKRSRATSSAR
jgi:hypothetical protein